jgi:phosphoribosylglycinamide formyltransferase-1
MADKRPQPHNFNIVVLISGNGTNLQSIIDQIEQGRIPARITAVISNKGNAFGLQRAERAGIPAEVIDHRRFASREEFDRRLMERIDAHKPDLVVLAGFMRILTDEFVEHYNGRMINIHPSLLPKHRGLNTHQRALDEGDRVHGASVHYVVPELDSGPVILQAEVPVFDDDDAEQLAERVHRVEHIIYPESVRRIAEGRVELKDNIVLVDGRPATEAQVKYPVDLNFKPATPSNN